MARTGLKKTKPNSQAGSQAPQSGSGKKTQSSSAASSRPKSKSHDATHQQRQEQRRHATRNTTANSKSKAKTDGVRDDIDETFKKMRSENGGDASALRVRQERPHFPKLGQDSTSAATSKQAQDQLLQTFESLMA